MDKEKLLGIACKLGRGLLENGGEIYRVEESIKFFLASYGIDNPQVFAIPATIIVTVADEDGRPGVHGAGHRTGRFRVILRDHEGAQGIGFGCRQRQRGYFRHCRGSAGADDAASGAGRPGHRRHLPGCR